MTEELAFQQIFWERGAILGHEQLVSALRAVVHAGRDELLARARLAFDQHADARVDHLVELTQELAHGPALADDLHVTTAGAFATAQILILLFELGPRQAQALNQLRVGDGQRRADHQDTQRVDVARFEHGRRVAIVQLKHAQDRVVFPERDANRAADAGTEQRFGAEGFTGRIRGQHGGALGDHLAHDTARDAHRRLRRARSGGPTNTGDHRHEADGFAARAAASAFGVLAQHDGGVRGAGHEQERRVGDAAHHVGEAVVAHDFTQCLHQELQAIVPSCCQGPALAELAQRAHQSDFQGIGVRRKIDAKLDGTCVGPTEQQSVTG